MSPPWSAPSASSNPRERTIRPVRNGLTSTSSLRETISRPRTNSAAGATYAAAPIAPRKAVLDGTADDAAVPPEPEQRREEDPRGREDEAPELGMVVPALGLLDLAAS